MKAIILKRLFTAKGGAEDKRNKSAITSKYYPSFKRIVFIDSLYHKRTGHTHSREFITKKEAIDFKLSVLTLTF